MHNAPFIIHHILFCWGAKKTHDRSPIVSFLYSKFPLKGSQCCFEGSIFIKDWRSNTGRPLSVRIRDTAWRDPRWRRGAPFWAICVNCVIAAHCCAIWNAQIPPLCTSAVRDCTGCRHASKRQYNFVFCAASVCIFLFFSAYLRTVKSERGGWFGYGRPWSKICILFLIHLQKWQRVIFPSLFLHAASTL